jgi:hypothetical protein
MKRGGLKMGTKKESTAALLRERRLNRLVKLIETGKQRTKLVEELLGIEMKYQIHELGKSYNDFDSSSEASIIRSLQDASSLFSKIALIFFNAIRERRESKKGKGAS